jgi:hypothetical protein
MIVYREIEVAREEDRIKREEDVKRLKTWKEEKERRALADSSSLIDPAPSEPVVLPSSTSSRSIQLQPVRPDAKRLPPLQTIESRSLLSRLTYQQTPAGTVYHDPVRVALSVEEASMTRPVFTKADYLSELFTRDHEKVPGYLEQFPVLVSAILCSSWDASWSMLGNALHAEAEYSLMQDRRGNDLKHDTSEALTVLLCLRLAQAQSLRPSTSL